MINLFTIGLGHYEFPNLKFDTSIFETISYQQNFNNSFSLDMNILELPEFIDLKNLCQNCVDDYHNNLCKYTSKLEIISSWLNLAHPGESHHMHKHQNAILTGVFYFHDIEQSPITFYNPILQNSYFYEEPTYYNEYNTYSKFISFKKNTCIVFPSYLFHSVQTNQNDHTRHTLAFNVFYKKNQTIGNVTNRLAL